MGNQSAGTITEQFDLFLRSWKSADGSNKYIARVDRMIADGQVSIVVDYEDLLSFDTELATSLIENPDRMLAFFREAALQVVRTENLAYAEGIEKQIQVRIAGLIDKLPLRGVSAKYLDMLVAINGMVVRTSEIKPRVIIAAFACPNEHITYIPQLTANLKKPDKCSECNEGREFRLETKMSRFTDFQVIRLQELPEELPPGQLPQSIDAELLGDLVNRARPGDRIVITGIVRAEPESGIGTARQSTFRTRLDANYIDVRGKELEQIQITPEDEAAIRRIAESPRAYDELVKSIAPSIYGMEAEKEAALLLVAGAPQRTLPDGTTLRGDINALIVGDPGCLVGDERVVLSDGSIVKIEELGRWHLQPISVEVQTDCRTNATATLFHKYSRQKVMELVTESGRSIKGTHNHPLLSYQNGNFVWKRLDQFREGDLVSVIRRIPCRIKRLVKTDFSLGDGVRIFYPKYFDLKFASFLGYMLSHGWVDESSGRFGFTTEDHKVKKLMISYVEKLYNLKPEKVENRNGKFLVEYRSQSAVKTLREVASHRVPDGIMKSGNRVLKQFFKWLFKDYRAESLQVLRNDNVELLRDIQMLLLRFSVRGRIRDQILEIYKDDILLFKRIIAEGQYKDRADNNYSKITKDEMMFERIASISNSDTLMDVYDIEVPSTHRFIANGIISHNTGKSELLKYVARLAPRGLYTSGRGSTAAGLCVSPDSFIVTPSGVREIGQIVENELTSGKMELSSSVVRTVKERRTELLIPAADEIKALVRKDRHLLLLSRIALDVPVYGHAASYYKILAEEVIRFRTSLGKELGATPETRIMCFDPVNRITYWKQIGILKVGDWVVTTSYLPEAETARRLDLENILDDEDLVELDMSRIPIQLKRKLEFQQANDEAAVNYNRLRKVCEHSDINIEDMLTFARGFYCQGTHEKISLSRQYKDIICLAGICCCASSIKEKQETIFVSFNRKKPCSRFVNHLNQAFGFKASPVLKDGKFTVSLTPHLSKLVMKIIGVKTEEDTLDLATILSLSNDELALLLSSLADSTAVVHNTGIELRLQSLKVARYVDVALMRFGIVCNIEAYGDNSVKLKIADEESTKSFLDNIASPKLKRRIARKHLMIKTDEIVRIGKFYVAAMVKSIEKSNSGLVYDLTVEENDAFVANGFLVHNTAAVVKEKSGLMMLEAGAVVLADLGVACIDEFDKMRPDDRGVLHEVMEQQTVSVAKGGIVATLNARTSIVAAANPLLGTYDPFKNIYENVNLPIPLLSRFDIIFIVKDTPDRIVDEKLAMHILRTHRSRGFVTPPPIDFELLRKYIVYCKKVEPVLTQEAESKLLEFYLQMRSIGGKENMITVTPRQLESLIRLATARARLLLRDKVTEEDALVAISLVRRMLGTVGIDVRTGKIDIGVLSGRASSEKSLIELALDVFKDLQGPDRAPVSLSAFTDALEKTGKFSKEEARKMINMLYKMGQIYEIKPGYYSRIT